MRNRPVLAPFRIIHPKGRESGDDDFGRGLIAIPNLRRDVGLSESMRNRSLVALRIWAERYSKRQGERSGQCRSASVAQAVVFSVWHEVHGLGILYLSVIAGVMNAKVCARTLTSAIVVSICGMWQSTHSLPGVPALWWV